MLELTRSSSTAVEVHRFDAYGPLVLTGDEKASSNCSPSQTLRALVRLDNKTCPPLSSVQLRIEQPNGRELSGPPRDSRQLPDWRSRAPYVRLIDAANFLSFLAKQNSEHLTALSVARQITRFRSYRNRVEQRGSVLKALETAARALGIPSQMLTDELSGCETTAELAKLAVALAISSGPSVVLIDAAECHEHGVDLERIAKAVRDVGIPAVYACDRHSCAKLLHSALGRRLVLNTPTSVSERSCVVQQHRHTCKTNVAGSKRVAFGERERGHGLIRFRNVESTWRAAVVLVIGPLLSAMVSSAVPYSNDFAASSRDSTGTEGSGVHPWAATTEVVLTSHGPNPISVWQLLLCSVPVFGVAIASNRLDIGLEGSIIWAAIRCTIQLSLLGLLLVPIFARNAWWQVLGYMSFMVLVAAHEATKRTPYKWNSHIPMYFWVLASLGSTMAAVTAFGLWGVLGVGLRALEAIPVGGMVLNSCLSSTAVALSNSLSELAERKENVEVLLALGATRFEATRDLVRRSVVLGMTPMVSLMSTTGIVSMSGTLWASLFLGKTPLLFINTCDRHVNELATCTAKLGWHVERQPIVMRAVATWHERGMGPDGGRSESVSSDDTHLVGRRTKPV